MRNRISLLFLIAMFGLFSAGCGSGGSIAGIGTGQSVSLDEEWQLGNQMAAQVESQVKLVHNSAAEAYVTRVGERIHAATPLANRPFTFHIVDDPSVNAFSIPGGHVYVNTGLIAQADHANMLAGVLAHEISHVVARHVIKQVEQQQAIGTIGSILLGQNPGAIQTILANIIAGGAMARFSRSDEKEADDLGLQFMTTAGYDPHGMLDMFQKLLSMEQGRPGAVDKFFLDHPLTQDRINDIRNRITQMGNPTGIVDDPAYQDARRQVM
jgi:beta-barrel assembly-enhancing protease